MADAPVPRTLEDLTAPGSNDLTTTEAYKIVGSKWNGKGAPPSREAAIGWLLIHDSHMTVERAKKIVGESGTLTTVGNRVRKRPGTEKIREQEKRDRLKREADEEAEAQQTQAEAIAEELGLDDEQAGQLEALLGGEIGDPNATGSPRGAPLWRYEVPKDDQGVPMELTVKDRSRSAVDRRDSEGKLIRSGIDQGERDSRRGRPWLATATGSRTGARYYEQDSLEPLKWSAEQRADLQRVLNGIGIYGKDAKIRLGSWTAKDQAVYAELLASANEEGLTWQEMLVQWKRHPPEDLLAEINGDSAGAKRAPLVVQHTNPIDVQETAREVSRGLIGREDRGFIERTPGGYNQIETQTQTAAYNAADPDGSGGTVTDAPSVGAYASDQLRRTKGTEVDSYATLGAFNEVLRQLGLAG